MIQSCEPKQVHTASIRLSAVHMSSLSLRLPPIPRPHVPACFKTVLEAHMALQAATLAYSMQP